MRKKKAMLKAWKRFTAFTCAAALVLSGMTFGTEPLVARATETNYIVDGDLGDDDGEAFWSDGVWQTGNIDWAVTDSVDHNQYAGNGTTKGLAINYIADGTVDFYQTIASLEAGSYTLTGYIKAASGLKVYCGDASSISDELLDSSLTSEFQQFTYQFTLNEAVTNYVVGFQVTGASGAWVCMDTLSLTNDADQGSTEEEQKAEALTSLGTLITECGALTETDYNPITWSALTTALSAAEAVQADSANKTLEEVNTALTNLQTAKAGLWPAGTVYLENIENGVPSDWNVVWSVGEETSGTETGSTGSTVWNIYSGTAQTITMTKSLSLPAGNYKVYMETAGGAGTVTGNISISDGTNTQSADMTVNAWDDYQPATSSALTLVQDTAVTLTIYADIQAGGYFKIDNITVLEVADDAAAVEKAEKLETLNTLITECKALTEANYSEITWSALKTALASAEAVVADSANKTLDEINAALTSLQNAKAALAPTGTVYVADMESGLPTDWNVTWSVVAAESKTATVANSTVWNIWSENAQVLTLTKTMNLPAGNYAACFDTAGGSGTVTGTIAISDGTSTESADMVFTSTWDQYTTATTKHITLAQSTDVTVTITANLAANGYFTMDNIKILHISDEQLVAEKTQKLEALKTLITACKALNAADWTADSYATLTSKLSEAETFYASASANLTSTTTEAIVAMTTALQAVKDALVSASIVPAEIYVDKLELSEDFIKGVDISSYVAEKQSGVVYRDFDGNVMDDAGFFNLLKEAGVNWVRIRVWNNPYDANGNGYGGGNNDLEKAKTMGKLATDAGLQVLIDFHYSDFWADPAAQDAPKAWEEYSLTEKETAVYNYTLESLTALHNAGVDVRMIQIGNETNNGICGEMGSWANRAVIFNAGSRAVRAYEDNVFGADVEDGSEVMVAVHFTEPNTGIQASIAENLATNNVDYDVFATSYYPFWHGTLENLQNVLSDIASTYGKKVMVAETSYAYTFEDGDGHENNVRADQASSLALDYNISIQGQADSLTDIMRTVNNTTNGIGMFYWEPAWIPVQEYDADAANAAEILASNKAKWEQFGSGWAASYSAEYDAENAGRYYGGSSWDNQALFDHNGNPHDSLNTFKYVDTGATTTRRLDNVKSCAAEFDYGQTITLPSTVTGIYNDGSEEEISVTWNANEIAAIKGFGSFTVSGVAGGLEAICNVEVLPINLLTNGGFEAGIGEGNGWIINTGDNDASLIKIDNKDIKRGSNALKFDAWSATLTDVTVTQTVTGLPAGNYACFMNVEGAGETDSYTISISAKGDTDAGSDTADLLGWMVWDKAKVENIKLANGGDITVTITITTTALETWGTIDEVYLYEVVEDDTNDDTSSDDGVAGDDSEDSDSEDSDSEDSNDSSDASVDEPLEWSEVEKEVSSKVNEIVANNSSENVNMDFVISGETKIPSTILNSIKNKNVTVAFHSGNGVALSISGKDLKNSSALSMQNVDLTIDNGAKNIPENIVESKDGSGKRQIAVKDTGAFGVPVNMHVGVGVENAGKYANLYRYNHLNGRLEYCGSYQINKDGQSMFALRQGGDYLLTITVNRPHETVLYSVGGDYTIQSGDTLSAIAARYRIPVIELFRKNPQLTDVNTIIAGQELNLN